MPPNLPRLLIIDDLFGRSHPGHPNLERADLCGQFLLEDVTGDQPSSAGFRIKRPTAQAVFNRGQNPRCAAPGDVVENDLAGTLRVARDGWFGSSSQYAPWSMVLLDLCFYTGLVTEKSDSRTRGMPEGRAQDDDPSHYFGLTLLSALNESFPDLPVIILSSQAREDVSREFAARGALGFLPRSEENAPALLKEYIQKYALIGDDNGEIVGHSKALLLALRSARQAASGRRNVLIRGERGTGKELLARYIHRHRLPEQAGPYVVVDSGALSPQLYASELFGHRKGAFTGADRDREGKIIQANGGDLFLDEIGNMPADVQIGLLRVLEQREVTPLGSQRGYKAEVRFLSATNEDIESRALSGSFRADLLDRLREGGTIQVPPLRDRLEDLPLLAETLVREAESGKPGAMKRTIEPDTVNCLLDYSWPGNIRELRNAVYGAVSRYADVEHLFPIHFQIGAESHVANHRLPSPADRSITAVGPSRVGVPELLKALERVSAKDLDSRTIMGLFPGAQQAIARFQATLLKSALEATRRPTPECPEGEILIHPAIKLLLGDRKVSASKAADVVKKVLNLCPELRDSFLSDPTLKEAFEISTRLRPGRRIHPAE